MNEKIIDNEYIYNLIKEVRSNNENSLNTLINIFKPHMISLSRSMHNNDFYEDLLGELLELTLNISLNIDNVKSYIKICLKNYYMKSKKNYRYNVCLNELNEELYSTEKESIENTLLEKRLEKESFNKILLEILKGEDREIFIAYYLKNKSIKEIEILIGHCKSTVYNKLNKIRSTIEEYIRNEVSI